MAEITEANPRRARLDRQLLSNVDDDVDVKSCIRLGATTAIRECSSTVAHLVVVVVAGFAVGVTTAVFLFSFSARNQRSIKGTKLISATRRSLTVARMMRQQLQNFTLNLIVVTLLLLVLL